MKRRDVLWPSTKEGNACELRIRYDGYMLGRDYLPDGLIKLFKPVDFLTGDEGARDSPSVILCRRGMDSTFFSTTASAPGTVGAFALRVADVEILAEGFGRTSALAAADSACPAIGFDDVAFGFVDLVVLLLVDVEATASGFDAVDFPRNRSAVSLVESVDVFAAGFACRAGRSVVGLVDVDVFAAGFNFRTGRSDARLCARDRSASPLNTASISLSQSSSWMTIRRSTLTFPLNARAASNATVSASTTAERRQVRLILLHHVRQ